MSFSFELAEEQLDAFDFESALDEFIDSSEFRECINSYEQISSNNYHNEVNSQQVNYNGYVYSQPNNQYTGQDLSLSINNIQPAFNASVAPHISPVNGELNQINGLDPSVFSPDINITSNQSESERVTRKHKRSELIDYLSNDSIDLLNSFGESDQDLLKVMRVGSLDRIIASSVVARRSSSELIVPPLRKIDHEENRKKLLDQFIKALKRNDMNGLATFISESFTETSYLSTPDLSEPACRKSRIMMYFALLFESFPDAIWKMQSSINVSKATNTATVAFTFTGTYVFDQSMDTLFQCINLHVQKIDDSHRHCHHNVQNVDCEFVASHMSEYVRMPPPIISPQVQFSKCQVNSSGDLMPATSQEDDGECIHVNSLSKVNVSSIRLSADAVVQSRPASVSSKRPSNGFKEDALSAASATIARTAGMLGIPTSSLDSSIRDIANKALRKGFVKQNRRMDILFNDLDQIEKIIIT